MTAIFAREVTVNGEHYLPGHQADTVGLTDSRFRQMVNLRRIIDSEDPTASRLIPNPQQEPLLVANAAGEIVGAVPLEVPVAAAPPVADGTDEEGLWPCRASDCDRRLGSERARDNHEAREHS